MSANQLPKDEQFFCYLFIYYAEQAYACYGVAFITILFIIRACNQYRKATKIDKINLNMKLIYISFLVTASIYLIKLILSEILFWYEHFHENLELDEFNSTFSKYVFLSSFMEFFFFQTMLLLVSYNWIGNIVELFQFMLGPVQSIKYIKTQKKLLKVIKVCLLFGVLQLIEMIPFGFSKDPSFQIFLASGLLIVWIIQQFFIAVIFVFDAVLIYRNQKLKQLLFEKDRKDMMRKYAILAILVVFKLGWGIYTTIIILTPQRPFLFFQCQVYEYSAKYWGILMAIFVVQYLLQCAIVWIVLKLYRFQPNQSEVDNNSRADTLTDNNLHTVLTY